MAAALDGILSDSDDELLYNLFLRTRKQKTVRHRPDLMNEYDDDEFFTRFRLKKDTVLMILDLINNDLEHSTER